MLPPADPSCTAQMILVFTVPLTEAKFDIETESSTAIGTEFTDALMATAGTVTVALPTDPSVLVATT